MLRRLAPSAAVVDLTHHVPRQDVRAGALTLWRCLPWIPPGVVVAVVDPGVGTARRAVAVEVGVHGGPLVFVGPDNGLLYPALAAAGGPTRAVALTDPAYHLPAPGPTFAGRDVFAPAAAHLCLGVDLDDLGPRVDPGSLAGEAVPAATAGAGELVAQVLWADTYGNLQLSAPAVDAATLGSRLALVGAAPLPSVRRVATFADLSPGELGLLVDSYGMLALCVNRGSARLATGLEPGDRVVIRSVEP